MVQGRNPTNNVPVMDVSIIGRRPNLSITDAPQKANAMFYKVRQPLIMVWVREFVMPMPLKITTR
jgi:hypothetical protein